MIKFNRLQNITQKTTLKNFSNKNKVKEEPVVNTIKSPKKTLLEQINLEDIKKAENRQSHNPITQIKDRIKKLVKKKIKIALDTFDHKSNSSSKIKKIITNKRTGINSKTVKRLENLDIVDFLHQSNKFISESIGIPQKLNAKIYFHDMENKNTIMSYNWTKNQIGINLGILDYKFPKIFGILRHEIEHQKQCFDAMRIECFGEEVVKKMAHKETTDYINYIIQETEHYSLEELNRMKLENHDFKYNELIEYKIAQKNRTETQYLKMKFKNLYSKNLYKFNNLRYTIIKEMGTIPSKDNLAKSARANMETLFNEHLTDRQRKTSNIEREAYFAGLIGEIEYKLAKWLDD